MAKENKYGVFCLEGSWWGLHDSTSVEPALQLLKSCAGIEMPYIHRDVGTQEEFRYDLSKWAQKEFDSFPILYLAFHGDPGNLFVGDRRKKGSRVSLDQISDFLQDSCSGRILHFGCCATLNVEMEDLDRFLQTTQAIAVLGYRKKVDWVQSAAFELIMLAEIQRRTLSKRGLRASLKKINSIAGDLSHSLGFTMRISS
jgi:hypothetical protein